MNKECRYSLRAWLNDEVNEFTGSVAAFDGNVERRAGHVESVTFLEVADCHGKVCLHQAPGERQAFVRKIRKLAQVANRFADALDNAKDE